MLAHFAYLRYALDMKINPYSLAEIRESRGLSKSALAVQATVSLSYLSELESGVKPGTPAVIKRLAEALGCNMYALVQNPGEKAA